MKIREDFLAYNKPTIDEDDIDKVVETLKSGWLSRGQTTNEFEEKFKEFVGAKHAIAVNSATAALHLSLLAAGVGEGDEVITTPLTFASSVNTILHCGATPVLVDIDPITKCIDPNKIREKITEKTKAIVPVHFAGHACKMDEILEIAKEHNLYVSEDAAHAVYTKYKDKMIGSIGNSTSFSFYATKNICTGEGGMFTTNDDKIAEFVREISLHGMNKNAWNRYGKKGSWKYDVCVPGYKYNMTGMQGALGVTQLEKLESMQNRREAIAKMYNDAFRDYKYINIPGNEEYTRHAWHIYYIEINKEMLKISRDDFFECLKEMNIGTSVHFIPVHLMSVYRERFGYKEGDFPIAEEYFSKTISLPLFPKLKDDEVQYVIDSVKYLCEKYKK